MNQRLCQSKKNLLLIYPSQLFAPGWGAITIANPSLVNLFSYLEQYKDISIHILDLDIEIDRPNTIEEVLEFKNKAARMISKYNIDIVGISCSYSINYLSSIMVAEICKNINKDCIIAVGGMHASTVSDDFIYAGSPFDFIVIGEGEKTLRKICQGKFKKNSLPRKIIGEPINLSNALRPNFKEYKYFHLLKEHVISYSLSRGCPYKCSFCIESVRQGADYRSFPVKKAVQEIQKATLELGIKKIQFIDPCFGFKKEWRKAFLNTLIKMKIKCIFEFETRVDVLDQEDIDLLSKLNIQYLFLGLEHASPRMLYLMQKTKNPTIYLEKAKRVLRCINEKDIPNKLLLIFNHPGETKKSILEGTKFLGSIFSKLKNISTIISPKNYFLTPGTKTYYNIKKYKKEFGTIVKHDHWWKEPCFDQYIRAIDILPSRDLYYGNARDFWMAPVNNLKNICMSKRTDNFLAFEMASEILLEKSI